MDRQENKIPPEYQNIMHYNQPNWNTNQYTTPQYVNHFDQNANPMANPMCQMICTQSQNAPANMDYYHYGVVANPSFQYGGPAGYGPNTSSFLVEPSKTIYSLNRMVGDDGYHPIPAPHLQQRSGPMRIWLNTHLKDPYPSAQEKQKLAEECNKTYIQVCTWFANARRSLRRQGAIGPRIRRNKLTSQHNSSSENVNETPEMQSSKMAQGEEEYSQTVSHCPIPGINMNPEGYSMSKIIGNPNAPRNHPPPKQ